MTGALHGLWVNEEIKAMLLIEHVVYHDLHDSGGRMLTHGTCITYQSDGFGWKTYDRFNRLIPRSDLIVRFVNFKVVDGVFDAWAVFMKNDALGMPRYLTEQEKWYYADGEIVDAGL